MLPTRYTYKKLVKLVFFNTLAILAIVSIAHTLTFANGATPKFFLCPKGMTRFATIVTTKHEINLCRQEGGKNTFLAVRFHHTRRVVTIPIVRSKQYVYIAKSPKGIFYNLNTKANLLTIMGKNGKISQEKVVAAD